MPPPPWDGAGGVQEAHNQDDSDEEQEQEQDEDLELMEVPGAEAPFPSDEYLALADSLTQLHVANFAPGRLAEAVAAAGERGVLCGRCALCAGARVRARERGPCAPHPGVPGACVGSQLAVRCTATASNPPCRSLPAETFFRGRKRWAAA